MSQEGVLGLRGSDLRQGDCLDVMKHIPAASVDMVLVDPP
jgi:DNA modification methylase